MKVIIKCVNEIIKGNNEFFANDFEAKDDFADCVEYLKLPLIDDDVSAVDLADMLYAIGKTDGRSIVSTLLDKHGEVMGELSEEDVNKFIKRMLIFVHSIEKPTFASMYLLKELIQIIGNPV